MRIPGLRTVRRAGLWLSGRVTPGAIVLGYHRIADVEFDPFEQCVSPPHFAEQLRVIRRLATPLPLADLVRRAAAHRLPRRAVAITFDDGYADLLDHALPLLRAAEMPATVFAVSGMLGSEYWWDRLDRTLWTDSHRTVSNDSELDALHRRLRTMTQFERHTVLRTLEDEAGVETITGPRSLSAEELSRLAAEPLIDIGAHTRTHVMLSALGLDARTIEIRRCKEELEEVVGMRVPGFSFPYGDESPTLREEVRKAGYDFACTSSNGVLASGDDRFAVPRWWIGNVDGDVFARWLGRWLHG